MAGRWTSRTFLALGAPVFLTGLALLVWEHFQSADIELVASPVLLVGLLLLFEGYLSWRRKRVAGDNPK